MKLLVVDDEALICNGICRMLAGMDCVEEIRSAFSGLEALEIMRAFSPDMVLSDILMPGMNGLEFIRRASAEFPCDHYYLLTNYARFQYAREAIELGVRGYLLKPVEREELYAAVCQAQERICLRAGLTGATEDAHPAATRVEKLLKEEPSQAYALTKVMNLVLTNPASRPDALQCVRGLQPDDAAVRTLKATILRIPWEGKGSRSLNQLLLTLLHDRNFDSTLTDIAEKVHLHPSYVSTTMTRRLGVSYSHFVNCLRVARAQQLLLSDESMSVSDVCRKCGFENSNHFFCVFKQWTGLTPREYRTKENRNERQTDA